MGGGLLQLIVTSLLLDLHMCPPLVVKTSSLKGNTFWLVKFSHHSLFRKKSDLFLWHFQETFGQDCHIFCNFKLIAKNKPTIRHLCIWLDALVYFKLLIQGKYQLIYVLFVYATILVVP